MSDLDDLADEFRASMPRRKRKLITRGGPPKPQCQALTVANARCQYPARRVREGRPVCVIHATTYLPITFIKRDEP